MIGLQVLGEEEALQVVQRSPTMLRARASTIRGAWAALKDEVCVCVRERESVCV
jgi:hypothetical protein